MKIVVDKLPESPKQCPFSEVTHQGYGCTLRPYIEHINHKPKCICKDVKYCDRLIELGEVKIKI